MPVLRVAACFTETPGGRSRASGEFSAEEFFEDHLRPKLQEAILTNQPLLVELDGVAGYASSFLDEAFGRVGLWLGSGFAKKFLVIRSEEEPYLLYLLEEIDRSMQEWAEKGPHPNSPLAKGKK